MGHRYVRTPVNVGEKLRKQVPADEKVELSGLRDAAEQLFESYKHRRSRFLDIDYKVDDKQQMQFHVFPRVPEHENFYPSNQAFAEALEAAVKKVLGPAAGVVAEFHEKDGAHIEFEDDDGPQGFKTRELVVDTRVETYLRKEDGALTHILHRNRVPMVWFCVTKVPGLMMPKTQVAEILVETIIETTERLLPRA